jgi:hypothetical protein
LAARQLPGSRRRSDVRRPICTWWSIPAAAAHRPRGTASAFGTNSRVTRRAGELAAADPANRARLGRRLQLAARSRMEKLACGASFGHEPERAIDHGALGGRERIRCAVGRLCDAPRPGKTPLYCFAVAVAIDGPPRRGCRFASTIDLCRRLPRQRRVGPPRNPVCARGMGNPRRSRSGGGTFSRRTLVRRAPLGGPASDLTDVRTGAKQPAPSSPAVTLSPPSSPHPPQAPPRAPSSR